jgi:hypothetical protein
MIKIQFVSPGAKISVITNGYTGEITPLHVNRQYADNEVETIVVDAGMLVYSCEDDSFVALTTGNKKAVFDVSAPVIATEPEALAAISIEPVAQEIPPLQTP